MKSEGPDNLKQITTEICQAVIEGKGHILEKYSLDFDLAILQFELFPADIFKSILEMLRHPNFKTMHDSYFLLNGVFKSNLGMLSDTQRNELFKVLEEIYDGLLDSTTCMLALEIMVDLFADERSLDALIASKTVSSEIPRAIVAYGLHYFIEECHGEQLKARALDALTKMEADPSELVRGEVRQALSKLK
jgi:hypothetical protein